MAKIYICDPQQAAITGITHIHYCPGCKCDHGLSVGMKNEIGASWTFNGDVNQPSFNPSIHIKWFDPAVSDKVTEVCHYFLREGIIQFLQDCTHALKGQWVTCPEYDDPH